MDRFKLNLSSPLLQPPSPPHADSARSSGAGISSALHRRCGSFQILISHVPQDVVMHQACTIDQSTHLGSFVKEHQINQLINQACLPRECFASAKSTDQQWIVHDRCTSSHTWKTTSPESSLRVSIEDDVSVDYEMYVQGYIQHRDIRSFRSR
jgi:hypothetical protein